MKPRVVLVLSLVSASAVAALVSACSGGDNTALDAGDDATTTDAQSPDAAGDAVASEGGGNDATPAADAGCAKSAGCRACCLALYPDAAAFFASALETCACTTPGDCKAQTVCGGNLCNGGKPSAACDVCLGKADAGSCTTTAITACNSDPSCTALIGCIGSCSAPTDAGGGG